MWVVIRKMSGAHTAVSGSDCLVLLSCRIGVATVEIGFTDFGLSTGTRSCMPRAGGGCAMSETNEEVVPIGV